MPASAQRGAASDPARAALLCRVGGLLCAIPVAHVAEIMRPMPVRLLPETPPVVAGVAMIRGGPVPILDTAALFDAAGTVRPLRLIVLRLGGRRVGLPADAVLGVRDIAAAELDKLPALLANAPGEMLAAIGTLDGELLVALEAARLVPDEILAAIEDAGEAA